MIVPNARSVLPTSSVTVLGFGSAESKLFLNFFIQDAHVGVFFQLEVVNILRVEVYVGVLDQRVLQKRGQVHLTGAGACGRGFDLEQVGAAHQLIDGAHAELCHVLAQVLGHEAHKVHDVLGLAL